MVFVSFSRFISEHANSTVSGMKQAGKFGVPGNALLFQWSQDFPYMEAGMQADPCLQLSVGCALKDSLAPAVVAF